LWRRAVCPDVPLRRTHPCDRCGAPIDPGDRFAAVDVLDADGRSKLLLCVDCGRAFRAFVDDGDA
jgi:hypothetical protein